jgi:DNA polymerase-3 subunit beta
MKFTTTHERLHNALSRAVRVTTKNTALPLLSCVLIEAHGDVVSIRASNLDVGVEIKIPARVSAAGVSALPGNILGNFIALGSGDRAVDFTLENGEVAIAGGGRDARIRRMAHEEFPVVPKVSDGERFSLPVADLVRCLRAVSYSAALTTLKPELSSVSVTCDGGFLTCAATDAFRLAEKRVRLRRDASCGTFLVPAKSVGDIVRVLDALPGDADALVNKNQCSISCGDVYLTSRLTDGVFPDYEQFMPKERQTEALVLRQDFLNALKATSIFSDQFQQVSMRISPAEGVFEMETRNESVGSHTELLNATLEGSDVAIRLNGRYLMDPLQAISSDSLILRFNGGDKPIVMSGVGDQTFRYLVMPMNR